MGRYEFPLAALAIIDGGHVRVGFEDNVYLSKGVPAKSNGELGEKHFFSISTIPDDIFRLMQGKTYKKNGFRATKLAAEGGERVAEFAAQNWKTILIVAVFGLMALLLITGLQSCTVMAGTAGTGVTASSYFSKDKDMLGAEKAYAKLEQKLQRYLDTYEATHNYDEYHFYLDEIEV